MPLSTAPVPQPPLPAEPVTADIVTAGQPIPAIDRLRLMGHEEWEDFILEWAYSLKAKYGSVERCGGAGDRGRDVVAYEMNGQTDTWDNYQCKHYDHALHPGDVWCELGKLCYYTFVGEYAFPREYFFVA